MKYSHWKIPHDRPAALEALSKADCTPLLTALLARRGLREEADVHRFLYGGPELLSDPLLMPDVLPAVRRISRAVTAGEKMAVFGDYDVDGITSACLLSEYLRHRGADVILYIPDRLKEGYGLNMAAIASLHGQGVTLIITVDCGVTAIEETAFAASLGVDMIITDHHECKAELPDAVAVVDPKRTDGEWPGRSLAGVGVAYKLVSALDGDPMRVLAHCCDLVSVGTVADVMPLTEENRFIIRQGLACFAAGQCRPGLRALMAEAGVGDKRPTSSTLGFTLAPRLNAAGRLGHTEDAVRLLLTEDVREAERLARELCQKNRERQGLEQKIWAQALEALDGHVPGTPIVLASEGWHQGVIGIAASRLADAFSVPAVIICLDGDRGKGSCRSVSDFNIFEALTDCADCLESFGGHAMAAGITVRRDRVDELRRALTAYYAAHPPDTVPALEADLFVDDPALLSSACVESLDLLEPCGNGNPRPLLYLDEAMLTAVTPIGDGKHLRITVHKFGEDYDCVFFSRTIEKLDAAPGQRVDLMFTPQINDFRGRQTIQLVLADLRIHGEDLCRRLLMGERPAREETAAYLPERVDFTDLWRHLGGLGGRFCGRLQELPVLFGSEMEKICICLAVMDELGLARVSLTGDELCVDRAASPDRVNLDSSRLLRHLQGAV